MSLGLGTCHTDETCLQSVRQVTVLAVFGLRPEFAALGSVAISHALRTGIANNLHGAVVPMDRYHRPRVLISHKEQVPRIAPWGKLRPDG